MQDSELNELKELVKRDITLATETNHMLRDMRRSARLGLVFQIIYWLLILGVLGAGYYYVSPYINELFGFYRDLHAQNAESHNVVQSLFQTMGKYLQSTTTPK
jgi:hypothetical protein